MKKRLVLIVLVVLMFVAALSAGLAARSHLDAKQDGVYLTDGWWDFRKLPWGQDQEEPEEEDEVLTWIG